jgi:hypothetical protein
MTLRLASLRCEPRKEGLDLAVEVDWFLDRFEPYLLRHPRGCQNSSVDDEEAPFEKGDRTLSGEDMANNGVRWT